MSLNLAVAVHSSWAISGAFNSLWEFNPESPDWDSRVNYFEAGFGKFVDLSGGPFVLETFLGLGYGSINNAGKEDLANAIGNKLNANFIKPYLQPSLGIRGERLEFVFTPRLALVNYLSNDVRVFEPLMEISARNFFDFKETTFVFEPGFTLRPASNNVRLQVQWVYSSFSYQHTSEFTHNKQVMTFGLNFYIR